MNVYEPTGKKVESWPEWVKRLSEENEELRKRVRDLEKRLMEEQARSDK